MYKKYRTIELKGYITMWLFPIGGLMLLALMAGNTQILISPLSLVLLGVFILLLAMAVGTYAVISEKNLLVVKSFVFRNRISIEKIQRIFKVRGLFGIWNLGIEYIDNNNSVKLVKLGGKGAPKNDTRNFIQDVIKINKNIKLENGMMG